MTSPTNYEEYLKRFHENTKFEDFGMDTCTVTPCPFCAAPGFMKLPISVGDVRDIMEKGATCGECGRSAKAIFTDKPGGVSFEVVQTAGPDQPEWLGPSTLRRSIE